ncbi:hypothetical protein BGZ51_001532 [Haplosporangium sp. Z 767]|nr:hypothetical protein BGZ51_001532 [Haplosporangium sp. Z 767]KAF9192939.1 hypothetical protein BGZ50_008076 [Haplosporangium sp. Z 11]
MPQYSDIQAGQTVPHYHVHIIPRQLGDFANNDDIYDEITRNKSDLLTKTENGTVIAPPKGVDNEQRKPRSEEDMAKEATRLRSLFQQP